MADVNPQKITLTLDRQLVEFINARANLALRSCPESERANFRAIMVATYRALHASSALFVYVKGLKGPEAQIWPMGEQRVNQKPVIALQSHPLTTIEKELSIDKLKELFPYVKPEAVAETKIKLDDVGNK